MSTKIGEEPEPKKEPKMSLEQRIGFLAFQSTCCGIISMGVLDCLAKGEYGFAIFLGACDAISAYAAYDHGKNAIKDYKKK